MNIELYGLRIFRQVMEDKSFSAAARSLRVTQPTISQQISKLESDLGFRLFERIGHSVIPTPGAEDLNKFAAQILEQMEAYTEKLKDNRALPKGLVHYAMPESCQWTPHYKKIMAQIPLFPEVRFEIEILPNDLIAKGLLEGRFDFGFLCGERLAPELRFEKFSDETYCAVAADKDLLKPISEKAFSDLRLVTYPGWELFFNTWAKAHSLWGQLKSKLREPTVKIGSLAGAIHAMKEGAGVAIIPTHCVIQELDKGSIFAWKAKNIVASNPMYLAKRVGEKPTRRVELVINMLKEAKATLG